MKSAMGAMEVVERFPLGQFSGKIDVVCIAQQLVELSLIGPVGSLDLSTRKTKGLRNTP